MNPQVTHAAQQWLPQIYLKFQAQRLRPALELLARIPSSVDASEGSEPLRVLDLGAGTCNMAPAFAKRWPGAQITFVDTSASMLEQAKAEHAENDALDANAFHYIQESFETYEPESPVDVIYSNAALHWVNVDRQAALLPKLMSFLKPGGVLAFQIPDTRLQPSHQLMVEAAKQLNLEAHISGVRWVTCDRDPSFYYDLFQTVNPAIELDMWSTIYAQVLEGKNPVADFTSSTGLGVYLEALGGRTAPLALEFERKYRELIAQAYPKERDGRTIFNLKRFFLIATKPKA